MSVVIRVSESFYNQLIKAQKILKDFTGRDVSIPEITDKIRLKILILNKNPDKSDVKEIFADWDIKPIVIVVYALRKRYKRAMLIEERIFDFVPKFKEIL